MASTELAIDDAVYVQQINTITNKKLYMLYACMVTGLLETQPRKFTYNRLIQSLTKNNICYTLDQAQDKFYWLIEVCLGNNIG